MVGVDKAAAGRRPNQSSPGTIASDLRRHGARRHPAQRRPHRLEVRTQGESPADVLGDFQLILTVTVGACGVRLSHRP